MRAPPVAAALGGLALALAPCGCRALFGIQQVPDQPDQDGALTDGALIDARGPIDSGLRCSASAPFGAPVELSSLSTPAGEHDPRLTADELTIVYDVVDGSDGFDLYMAMRSTTADPFGPGVALAALNTSANDFWGSFGSDGVTLYFASNRAGDYQIFDAIRASPSSTAFGIPSPLGPEGDNQPYAIASDTALYFASTERAGSDTKTHIYRAELSSCDYGDIGPIAGTDPTADERAPAVTGDERTLYYCRFNSTDCDIWYATRPDAQSDWSAGQALPGEATVGVDEAPGWISPDGCRLYIRQAGSDGVDHLYELAK